MPDGQLLLIHHARPTISAQAHLHLLIPHRRLVHLALAHRVHHLALHLFRVQAVHSLHPHPARRVVLVPTHRLVAAAFLLPHRLFLLVRVHVHLHAQALLTAAHRPVAAHFPAQAPVPHPVFQAHHRALVAHRALVHQAFLQAQAALALAFHLRRVHFLRVVLVHPFRVQVRVPLVVQAHSRRPVLQAVQVVLFPAVLRLSAQAHLHALHRAFRAQVALFPHLLRVQALRARRLARRRRFHLAQAQVVFLHLLLHFQVVVALLVAHHHFHHRLVQAVFLRAVLQAAAARLNQYRRALHVQVLVAHLHRLNLRAAVLLHRANLLVLHSLLALQAHAHPVRLPVLLKAPMARICSHRLGMISAG